MPLVIGSGKVHEASPTIDRIDPAKGYVRGNIIVVSQKANTMKSNATIAEMRRLARFYTQLEKDLKAYALEQLQKGA